MPKFSLPYGKSHLEFISKSGHLNQLVEPDLVKEADDPKSIVGSSIRNTLKNQTIPASREDSVVAIAINDKTRPVPHQHLLPPLLAELGRKGYKRKNIFFVIATGTHLPMHVEEFPSILPREIINQYRVISHDCDDSANLVHLGFSSRNTPIEVNQRFMQADLKIVVGNIEPHHFSGFSGGYKSAVIGLGSRKMINKNHALLMEPNSKIAEFSNNPLRQDIEEIGANLNIHLALNSILNIKKKIVYCLFGDPSDVMQAGIPLSRQICLTSVKQKTDLVIASVGGHPKDINLYQSQKALSHAALLVKGGGVVILVAACPEGSGSKFYEDFMTGVETPAEALDKFRSIEFRVGPHKAFQFCRELIYMKIILVSSMDPGLVKKLLLVPAPDVQKAVDYAEKWLPADYSLSIMPRATNTIPHFEPL